MKRLVMSIVHFLFVLSVHAQIPQAFSFQGVAFDAAGKPLGDKSISVKAEILAGSPNGKVEYSEVHTAQTNTNGLYSLSIGLGVPSSGTFDKVNWLSGQKYLSISIDVNGGSNFVAMGVSQLLSVPYALVSGSSVASKPRIFVAPNPHDLYSIIYPINGPGYESAPGNLFRWIDGEPEDIFIEYKNLPENVHIYTDAVIGRQKRFHNYTKVDTIDFGIYERISGFIISDLNKPIDFGIHDIKAIYRTRDVVLDSITFKIKLNQYIYDDCLHPLVGEKTLVKVACEKDGAPVTDDFLNGLIGTKMMIKESSPRYLSIESVLNEQSSCQIRTPGFCKIDLFCVVNHNSENRTSYFSGLNLLPDNTLRFDLQASFNPPNANQYNCVVDYK